MRSSNPALNNQPFSRFGVVAQEDTMTVEGTVQKTLLLLLAALLPAAWVWFQFLKGSTSIVQSGMWIGMIGGFALSMVTIFKKNWAPITAPLYAALEGLFLGAISVVFQQSYPGIVFQAVSLSIATLLVMLLAYQMGWVRMTERFRMGVIVATGAVALFYLVTIVLGFFQISVPIMTGSGFWSIAFSLFVVGLAALNLILDFEMILQGARAGVPKYMEWYGAFALMVTLVWLYIELLRLLAKLNDRR